MSGSGLSMSLLDRMVAAVAPSWAASRAEARVRLEKSRVMMGVMEDLGRSGGQRSAAYRGAVATRSSQSWTTSTSYRGGRAGERVQQMHMRDRSREVYRSNEIYRSLLTTETDNIIADGLTLQMDARDEAGVSVESFNEEAEERFAKWLEWADITGKHIGSALFRLSWLQPRKDGDGGFVKILKRGYPYLQYVPGDLIRNPIGSVPNGQIEQYDYSTTFDGVECDPSGRPIAFWVRDVDEVGHDSSTRIPSRDFVYIPFLDDPLGVRGVPVGMPIFNRLDQIDYYVDAVTRAAIMAAIFGLIEKRRNPGAVLNQMGMEPNAAGEFQKAVTYEDGLLKVIGTDESLMQVQATQPMQQTPDFIRALFRIVCLAFDMPIEIGQKDLSQVNFSGGRIGLIAYYRSCRSKLEFIRGTCWNPIVRWWLSVERKRQQLGYPDAFKTPFPRHWDRFALMGREWDFNDPETEAKADLLEISMGVKSPQMACAARGRDFVSVARQTAKAKGLFSDLKLPWVLSSSTRDEATKVTAVDADGNPIGGPGGQQALNGVQATAVDSTLTSVMEGTMPAEVAVTKLMKLGYSESEAKSTILVIQRNKGMLTAADKAFQQQFLLKLMEVQGAKQVIYNSTDLKQTMRNAGAAVDQTVVTDKGDGQPLLPVVSDSGPLVSGAEIRDPEGQLVGGDVENQETMPGSAPAASKPATVNPGADQQRKSKDEQQGKGEDAEQGGGNAVPVAPKSPKPGGAGSLAIGAVSSEVTVRK